MQKGYFISPFVISVEKKEARANTKHNIYFCKPSQYLPQ